MHNKRNYPNIEAVKETLKEELKYSDRKVDECTKAISYGKDPSWFVDDLQIARAMKIECERCLDFIDEETCEVSFEKIMQGLYRYLVGDLIQKLSSRNVMSTTNNARNMNALHELTAKGALAHEFFKFG
jgi:hypothetical protein